jgi:hypothetical protein
LVLGQKLKKSGEDKPTASVKVQLSDVNDDHASDKGNTSSETGEAIKADMDDEMDEVVYLESSRNEAKIVLFSATKKPKEAKHAIAALALEEPFEASSQELDMSVKIDTPVGGMCHKLKKPHEKNTWAEGGQGWAHQNIDYDGSFWEEDRSWTAHFTWPDHQQAYQRWSELFAVIGPFKAILAKE